MEAITDFLLSNWMYVLVTLAGSILVLIFEGKVYGWKNVLRDAAHERPGALAVDPDGHVFEAQGDNDYDGASHWVAV